MFLNQRGAEFSFLTPSAPPRPIHSNLYLGKVGRGGFSFYPCSLGRLSAVSREAPWRNLERVQPY